MPDGTSDGMVVMELDRLEETVFALLETWDDYEDEWSIQLNFQHFIQHKKKLLNQKHYVQTKD